MYIKNSIFHALDGIVCQRSSDPFYIVSYYIKWLTTSWTSISLEIYCNFFAFDGETHRAHRYLKMHVSMDNDMLMCSVANLNSATNRCSHLNVGFLNISRPY